LVYKLSNFGVKGKHPRIALFLDFSGKPYYISYCDFFQVNSASVIVQSSSVKPTSQSAKKAEDDLEDWLDSVLG